MCVDILDHFNGISREAQVIHDLQCDVMVSHVECRREVHLEFVQVLLAQLGILNSHHQHLQLLVSAPVFSEPALHLTEDAVLFSILRERISHNLSPELV